MSSLYRTAEELSFVQLRTASGAADDAMATIIYENPDTTRAMTIARRGTSRQSSSNAVVIAKQPTPLSPSIRKELRQASKKLCALGEAMLIAHDGEGVDVVELANAVGEYRGVVDTLWRYREFGTEAWRSVIVLCQQALFENMHDEEMSKRQCECLKKLAANYLSNHMLANDDVSEVMTHLTAGSFDPMLFFSATTLAD